MPMWGATGRRGRAPRGRYAQRKRAKRFPYVSMSGLKALAKGGMSIYGGYKRRTSSKKKGVLKKRKMASKSSTRKGTALKTTTSKVRAAHAKMSDQRVTKMKFEDQGSPVTRHSLDNDRGYFAVQDTGGYRTVCLAVAGSFLRDTLGKNGIKFPSWNTHSEEASEAVYWDTTVQRCFGIQFYFSRTDSAEDGEDGTSGVSITETGLPWSNSGARAENTKLYLPVANSTTPVSPYKMKTLYELTDELADMLYYWAIRGFYPSAYEVCTQSRSSPTSSTRAVVVKFRESNLASASLSLLIDTKYQITNWSRSSGDGTGTDGSYAKNIIDKVPLQFTKFKMRNLGIKVRDSVLIAAKDLGYDIADLAVVNEAQGFNNLSVLKNSAGVWFNPFERTPQGPIVFKNLGSRSTFGLQPGASATQNMTFSYSGAFADLFKRVIQQEMSVKVTYANNGAQTVDFSTTRKVSGPMVPGGSTYVFAYERVKLMHAAQAISHKDRRFISTYCSFQPFKAAPLPVYNRTTAWNT